MREKKSVIIIAIVFLSIFMTIIGTGRGDDARAVNMGLYGGRVYIGNKSFAEVSDILSVVIEGPCGTFYSADGGENWAPGNEISGVHEIVKASTGELFCASGFTGVQKSSDFGVTWTTLTNPAGPNDRIGCIDIDSVDNLYIGSESAIYKSVNGGIDWMELSSFPTGMLESTSIAVVPDGSAVFCCQSDMLWKYTAGGGMSNAFAPAGVDARYVATNSTTVYVNEWNRSTDGGATWGVMTTLADEGGPLIVDPAVPNNLYTGRWMSSDSGSTWQSVPGGGVSYFGGIVLWVDPDDSTRLYGRNDRGPMLCTDGVSWVQINQGIDSLEVYDAAWFDTTDIFLGGSFHGLGRTVDYGSTWSWIDSADTNVSAVAVFGTGAYSFGARGFRESTDYGLTFTSMTEIPSYGGVITSIYVDSSTGDVYAAENQRETTPNQGGVYIYSGVSWSTSSFPNLPANHITRSTGIYYVGAGNRDGDLPGGVYTSNTGISWTQIPALALESVWDIDAEGPDIYAASGSDIDEPSVWFSHDTGVTWTESTLVSGGNGQVMAVLLDPADPTRVFAALNSQIWESTDGGATWSVFFTGEDGSQINVLIPFPDAPVAGIRGRSGEGRPILSFGSSLGCYNLYSGSGEMPIISSGDYNGDGSSDIAIFRESSGLWSVREITRVYFGTSSDLPVSGDYNGNNTTDIGIYRSGSGLWAIRGVTRAYFGSSSDTAIPGDYNGDGECDMAIFRDSSGLWAIRGISRCYFGGLSDYPAPGFYTGGSAKVIGIFRSSTGLWAIKGVSRVYFGSSSDTVVPGDYDGDGTWNYGVFRSSSGLWAIRGVTRSYFGGSADQPVPADFRGDGRDEIGIFREGSGLWAIQGVSRVYYGATGDIPVTR